MDAKVATVDDQPSIIYQTVNRQAQEQNLWVVSMFGGEPFKTSFPIPAQSACLSVSNVLNLFNQQGSNFLNQTHIAVAHRNQLYVGFVSQKSGIFSSSEMQMVSLSSGKDFKVFQTNIRLLA